MQEIGKLVYVKTVAKMLCCSEKHVYQLIRDGEIEAIRLGQRRIRVYQNSVIFFMDRAKIQTEDYYK